MGKRILVAWWGTSKHGSPTIGDHMAVSNLASALLQNGAQVDIASYHHVECGAANIVNWMRINPRAYRCVAFVCGPLSNEFYFRLFFFRFRRARKVAVGVSVIDPTLPGTRLFDKIIARDGMPQESFDLSLAVAPQQIIRRQHRHIAVCLRGHQSEYGDTNCYSTPLDSMIHKVARGFGDHIEHVSTVVGKDNTVQRIHELFADAKLVITTRLHGALLALYHRTPFVAIDQIKGGRKVASVLRRVPWNHVYPFDVDERTLERACRDIITRHDTAHRVYEASQCARALSQQALQYAVDSILDRCPVSASM